MKPNPSRPDQPGLPDTVPPGPVPTFHIEVSAEGREKQDGPVALEAVGMMRGGGCRDGDLRRP